MRKFEGKRRKRFNPSRGLTDMSRVVRFRLVDNLTTPAAQSSNGSGVLAGYQNADPSGGSGSTWTASEWTTLTSLYSQVRLVKMTVWFMPIPPALDSKVAGDISNYLIISSVLSSVASAPTSSAQVHDNADAKIHTLFTTSNPRPIKHVLRPKGKLNWAVVTTPNPGSYAGCPGAIQWYSDTLVVSQVQMAIKTEGIYEFRSRI